MRINAEAFVHESFLRRRRVLRLARGNHDRRWNPASHFLRVTGPREDDDVVRFEHFRNNFAHPRARFVFNSFGNADQWDARRNTVPQFLANWPHPVRRDGEHHQLGPTQRRCCVHRQRDFLRYLHTRQKHFVLARGQDRFDLFLEPTPQRDPMPVAVQEHRQRRPPSPRTDHRDIHAIAPFPPSSFRLPIRFSVPASSRWMFDLCL